MYNASFCPHYMNIMRHCIQDYTVCHILISLGGDRASIRYVVTERRKDGNTQRRNLNINREILTFTLFMRKKNKISNKDIIHYAILASLVT